MKTAIYARFSSTLQDARSVDDQVRICREKAEREGWEIVEVFADYAISGAVRNRPGLNSLMAQAAEFDIVLAEAIDRISRDQEDIAGIYKALRFQDCQLITLSEGPVSEIHIGFTGTMAALFRTNLADKIRRGQKGRVAAGRTPGNILYGYRKVARLNADGEAERGLREIDLEQAEVILRIFREAAAGQSARAIVGRLNAEGIPAPRGGQWAASVLNGSGGRGQGILQNEIYMGRLVYNRTRMVRDPETRRRVTKVNPREEWAFKEVPELRIVPQDLWDRINHERQALEGVPFHQRRRPKRLLSGLVQCGVCGGNYVQIGTKDALWACGTQRKKASCTNGRQISNRKLEERVLEGLQTRLLDPELVRLFIRRFHDYNARAEAEQNRSRTKIARKLEDIRGKVDRLVSAVANGGGEFEEIREVLASAKAERQSLERELAELDAEKIVPFMPNIGEEYQRAVSRLSDALSGSAEGLIDAVPALRSLVDSIRIFPRQEGRGVDIEVTGRLANMIAMATGKPVQTEGVAIPMKKAASDQRRSLFHRITRIDV